MSMRPSPNRGIESFARDSPQMQSILSIRTWQAIGCRKTEAKATLGPASRMPQSDLSEVAGIKKANDRGGSLIDANRPATITARPPRGEVERAIELLFSAVD